MGLFNFLDGGAKGADREHINNAERNERYIGSNPSSELQRRTVRVVAFPAIFGYLDRAPKDGYPDSPRVAFGSRFQGTQALSLRSPDDTRWLLDSQGTPIWLRTTKHVWEPQRNAHAPGPAASPYGVEQWHVDAYRGVPPVGHGPGSMLIVPLSQISD